MAEVSIAREGGVNPINAVNGRNRSEGKMVTKRTEYNRAFKAIGRIREMTNDRRFDVPSGDALRRTLGNASEEGLRMIQKSRQVSGRTKDFADEILRKLRNGR